MWKFCGKAQFPHSFGRIVRNCAKTVLFHKISVPANLVKLRYFRRWQNRAIDNKLTFLWQTSTVLAKGYQLLSTITIATAYFKIDKIKFFILSQFSHCHLLMIIVRKLCLSTKFPHQQIWRNYGILGGDRIELLIITSLFFRKAVPFKLKVTNNLVP